MTAAGAEAEAERAAFALGWEVASLFHGTALDGAPAGGGDGLPGLAAFSAEERVRLAVALIDARLAELGPHLGDGALDPTHLAALRAADPGAGPPREVLRGLHVAALRALTAASPRLGRGYGLGHALAETCLPPGDREALGRAFGTRAVAVKDDLADLSSSFPPHSCRAVVLSLRAWEAWAADPDIDGRPLSWEAQGPGVADALRRQGELWRDLLAGDKRGEDMLDTAHYLRAASSLVERTAASLWRFLRPLWLPLAIALPLLGVGIALLLLGGGAGKALGAALAAAGALGITGAGIRTRLGKVASQLQSRLWGAELDLAIAEAVLVGPRGWSADIASIAVPSSGVTPKVGENIEVLRRLRRAVADGSTERVRELLAPGVELVLDGRPLGDRAAIAVWLVGSSDAAPLLDESAAAVAIGSGVLLTRDDSGATVWRLQEGRVRRCERFADAAAARAAAEELA